MHGGGNSKGHQWGLSPVCGRRSSASLASSGPVVSGLRAAAGSTCAVQGRSMCLLTVLGRRLYLPAAERRGRSPATGGGRQEVLLGAAHPGL